MTDWSTVRCYESSPESVAFKLMLEIPKAEKRNWTEGILVSGRPRRIGNGFSIPTANAWKLCAGNAPSSNRSRIHCHPRQTAKGVERLPTCNSRGARGRMEDEPASC